MQLLQTLVECAAALGLDYRFLLDAYQRASLLEGAVTTLVLYGLCMIGSLAVGLLLAAGLISERTWLVRAIGAFVEVTRNTPSLVQLYCAFLVLNALMSEAGAAQNVLSPFAWVVIVLSLHKGVFHAEALRAGIEAVPKTTLDAAHSLAFGKTQLLLYVQLPLAARFALPALVNNLIDLAKMTAIASAIAVNDITYASIMIWTQGDTVIELMLILLAFFGALSAGLSAVGRILEQRLRMPGYGA